MSVTVDDEIVRTMLQSFAHQIRREIGCPVMLVIGASLTGNKIIIGADIDGTHSPMTAEAATEIVRRICIKVGEFERPTDMKLYGEGHES